MKDTIGDRSFTDAVLAGIGVKEAQPFLGPGILGVDFQDLLIMQAGTPGKFHLLIERGGLKPHTRVRPIDFERLFEVFDSFAPERHYPRQGPGQESVVFVGLRFQFGRLPQPQDSASWILGFETFPSLLNTFLSRLLEIALLPSQGEGRGRGQSLIVFPARGLVRQSLISQCHHFS